MEPGTMKTGGEWVAVGVAIGVAIGVAMDNIGAGIAIGLAIGVAIAGSKSKKSDDAESGDDE